MSAKPFKTVITSSGNRTYIVIPFNPNGTWGVKHRHYVAGSVNGCTIRGLIEPDGDRFVLWLGAAWRRDNGLNAGSTVQVILAPEGPQSDTLAEDVAVALNAEPHATILFDSLATFYRKNFIRWIDSAKRPETRAARIAGMLSLLKAGKQQR